MALSAMIFEKFYIPDRECNCLYALDSNEHKGTSKSGKRVSVINYISSFTHNLLKDDSKTCTSSLIIKP